jgi:hypothetical protein
MEGGGWKIAMEPFLAPSSILFFAWLLCTAFALNSDPIVPADAKVQKIDARVHSVD